MSIRGWFGLHPPAPHTPDKERAELFELQTGVRQRVPGTLLERSPAELIPAIAATIFDDAGCPNPPADIEQRIQSIIEMLFRDELLFRILDYDRLAVDLAGGVAVRNHLRRQQRFLERSDAAIGAWRDALADILVPIIRALPASVLSGTDASAGELQAPLITLTDEPAQLIENAYFNTLYSGAPEIEEFDLFASLRQRVTRNLEAASGILPGRPSTKPLLFPTQAAGKSPTELVTDYLSAAHRLPTCC